jgi:hypothetical protein
MMLWLETPWQPTPLNRAGSGRSSQSTGVHIVYDEAPYDDVPDEKGRRLMFVEHVDLH